MLQVQVRADQTLRNTNTKSSSTGSDSRWREALFAYNQMRAAGNGYARIGVLIGALKACRCLKDLPGARRIHREAVEHGEINNLFVANVLVDVYSKCGSIQEAREVFDKISQRSAVSWNSIIAAYAQNGQCEQALELFQRMRDEGFELTSVTLLAALKACSMLADQKQEMREICLRIGREIHSQAAARGIVESNTFVANSLVDMFSKCGSLEEARGVFESIKSPSPVSWNCIIMGYALRGQGELAMQLFARMLDAGFEPNKVSFMAALKACSSMAEREPGREFEGKVLKLQCLEKGRLVHRHLQATRVPLDIALGTLLIEMYLKCGALEDARLVFNTMKKRDLVLWTSLVRGLAMNGEGEVALQFYSRMQEEGCVPDLVAVLAALKACSCLASEEEHPRERRLVEGVPLRIWCLNKGRELHLQAQRMNPRLDKVLANGLVDMYVKCGSMSDACQVFESMEKRDVVSWTSMIQGYTQDHQEELALDLFWRMKNTEEEEGCSPDDVAYVAALQACSGLAEREDGQIIDGRSIKLSSLRRGEEVLRSESGIQRCSSSLFVANAALDMYSKCGSLPEALKLFHKMNLRDVVSWTCMINACALSGDGELAMEFYSRMQSEEAGSLLPNRVTILAALKACSMLAEKERPRVIDKRMIKLRSLELGRGVHRRAVELMQEQEIFVASSLVDFYSKCGSMGEAKLVFDHMRKRDVVSWTSMVLGYAEAGEGGIAMEFFTRMKEQGCPADEVSYLAALKACARMGALEEGRILHEQIRAAGFESSLMVANFLVDFYGKCGSMAEAKLVFDRIEKKNVVSWSSLIAGFSYTGDPASALSFFEQMQEHRFQPNGVTYLAVLVACAHAGLVDLGLDLFEGMVSRHGIARRVEHYTAMVDLLGRANRLDEALAMVEGMECGSDAVIWMTLLGAAHNLMNLRVAKRAFDAVVEFDEGKVHVSSAYVLISNVYSASGLKFNL